MTDRLSTDQLTQANALRQAGQYALALRQLEGCEDWPAPDNARGTLLKAQILVRPEPARSLELLAATQDLFETPEDRFAYYVTSGRAYAYVRNFEAAAEMARRAQPLTERVDLASRCWLWYQRAQLRLVQRQFDPADADVEKLLAQSDPNGMFLGRMLRAYMHAGAADYAAQSADLRAAVQIATTHPGTCDLALLALQVHALLRLGLETGDLAAMQAGSDGFEWIPWTDDLQTDRFLCLRALGWNAFLRGEPAQAQWLFKDSKACATNDAWRVMAHVDRAYVARMNGNEPWATEELAAAHAIARTVDWPDFRGEERQALVMLATLFAPTDMARAQHYVSLYMQLGKEGISPNVALASDRRADAFEMYAMGRVQQVIGNDTLAIATLQDAYEIFSAAGYRFRAALTAFALFEATGDGGWIERARTDAEIYPNSALYNRLAHQPAEPVAPPLRELTPLQRQVAYALCEGLELGELSQRFSRSAFTLERHVNAVYEHFGLKSRAALRACMKSWNLV